MRKFLLAFLVLGSAFLTQNVWAECPMGKGDCQGQKQCAVSGGHGQDESSPCPIIDKIMKKAHFLLENWEEIGLSQEQVNTIKDLKLQDKKSMIRGGADMEIMMLDMKSKLSEEVLDVEGMNAMIDEGMAQMTQSAKASVDVYAKLKAVLTPEQVEKAKALWTKKN